MGLVTVLYQSLEGVDWVIRYSSHSLSKAGSKYPAHKSEFLALKWDVTNMFYEYLYGNQFDLYNDKNPLTYVLSTMKLDATGHRWIAGLANFNFIIYYWSEKSSVEADALLGIQWNEAITSETVQKVITNVTQCIRSP